MKTLFITFSLIGSIIGGTAFANHKHNKEYFTDTARVIHSMPIYRTVRVNQPHQQCHEKETYYGSDGNSYMPMIAGGVIGGIVGNQFGKGNGKTFMTIAGSVIGSSIGHDVSTQNGYQPPHYKTVCETINNYHEEQVIDSYRVTYKYDGRKFTTTMPYDPGDYLKIKVSIRPL